MNKAKRGNTIDGMYLGKEPSFTSDDLQGSDRKMVILDAVNYYNYKYMLMYAYNGLLLICLKR